MFLKIFPEVIVKGFLEKNFLNVIKIMKKRREERERKEYEKTILGIFENKLGMPIIITVCLISLFVFIDIKWIKKTWFYKTWIRFWDPKDEELEEFWLEEKN